MHLCPRCSFVVQKVIDDEEIQHKIIDYQSVYSDHKFSTVYDLKYDLKNAILNLSEDSMKTVIEAVKQKLGDTSFGVHRKYKAVVTIYFSDDFDGKSAKDITSKDFDQSQYRVQRYNTSDKVKKGKVVARINKSEKWQIVIPLEADQYPMLKDKSEVIMFPGKIRQQLVVSFPWKSPKREVRILDILSLMITRYVISMSAT